MHENDGNIDARMSSEEPQGSRRLFRRTDRDLNIGQEANTSESNAGPSAFPLIYHESRRGSSRSSNTAGAVLRRRTRRSPSPPSVLENRCTAISSLSNSRLPSSLLEMGFTPRHIRSAMSALGLEDIFFIIYLVCIFLKESVVVFYKITFLCSRFFGLT